jgi:hypothetical protein
LNQVTWSITGCTLIGYTHNGGNSSAPMTPTTSKLQIEAQGILRKEDYQTCTGSFTPSGGGTPLPCTCKIEIDDPGQTKLLGC